MTNNVPPQQQPIRNRNHLAPLAMIAAFDIAGPLITYSVMRNAGQGAVPALILSGIFPAFGVMLGFARHRQVDAVAVGLEQLGGQGGCQIRRAPFAHEGSS